MTSVTIQDFVSLADELIQENGVPIKVRAAVSRAYYGAYHAARKFHEGLPSQGAVMHSGGGMHEVLIQCLENPMLSHQDDLYRRSQSLGYMLRRVRKCRHAADYDIAGSISIAAAGAAIAEAKKIISKSQT